ncbi:MAG: glutamate racemase [Verrucomicrobiota bacterium]
MQPNRIKALGVFDSGVGGLTVVKAIRDLVPVDEIIYLGDTARVPYGNKSPASVIRYAREISAFLLSHQIEGMVTACNTATAYALSVLQEELEIPVFGVIEPGVEAALAATKNGRIGIIGTVGTIGSQAYQNALLKRNSHLELVPVATPLLVPLIEEHWLDKRATTLIIEEYLEPIRKSDVDTLVLACTHYPLLKPVLSKMLGDQVVLVDSAITCGLKVGQELLGRLVTSETEKTQDIQVYLTDMAPHFGKMAQEFLGLKKCHIQVVSVS